MGPDHNFLRTTTYAYIAFSEDGTWQYHNDLTYIPRGNWYVPVEEFLKFGNLKSIAIGRANATLYFEKNKILHPIRKS